MSRHLGLLLVATSLLAQTIPEEEGKVRIRFRALSFDTPINGGGFLDNGVLRRLNIATDAFTAEQEYIGPRNLRFVTVKDPNKAHTPPPSPELLAAMQRLNRAKTATLKASEEFVEITKLLQKIGHQSSEKAKPLTQADEEQIASLEDSLRMLTEQMSAASKETEAADLQILRLQSIQRSTGEYPGGTENLDKKKKGPAAKIPNVQTPTVAVNFPHNGRYLLLFSYAGNDYQVLALDDTEGVFPYGSQLLINLTGSEIEIRYPGQRVRIPPNGHSVVKAPAPDYQYTAGEIYTQGADGLEIGCTLRTYQHPYIRTLYFLLPTEVGGHAVRLRGIEERKPKEATIDLVNSAKPDGTK
jgi:hypothetical protein